MLLGLLMAVALALAAGIGYGIYELATGGGGPAPVVSAPAAAPITTKLSELHREGDTTYFMVDNSITAPEFNLQEIPKALMALSDGDQQMYSNVRLVPFTDGPEGPSSLDFEQDAAKAKQKWLNAVGDLRSQNRPSYIYDVVADAHNALAKLNRDNGNNIILITDGQDGGYAISDIEAIGPCPPEVIADSGDVCGRCRKLSLPLWNN